MVEEIKPTKDVPEAEVKAEGQKLEWGPELGGMSWDDAWKKVVELNNGLLEREKKWRVPFSSELVAEFRKNNSTPVGFSPVNYWAAEMDPNQDVGHDVTIPGLDGYIHHSYSRTVNMENGNDGTVSERTINHKVRFVRDSQ